MKEKLQSKGVIIFIVFLALAFLFTSFPTLAQQKAESTPAPKMGGTLKFLWSAVVKNIGYPPELSGSVEGSDPALERLVKQDSTGKIFPCLATEWKIAPDLKSITFTLRKGVKFHDGTDFNAEAVKFNLEARKAAKRGDLDDVASMDVIDDSTIKLTLSAWNNALLTNLATYSGYIASPKAIKEKGKDWAMGNPVGTGAFQFASWDRDLVIKYKKFPGYWDKGKPYLDGIEIRFYADKTTMMMAFQAGEGHFVYPVDPEDIKSLKAAGFDLVVKPPDYTGAGVAFFPDSKNADSPWADKRVRMAFEYAVDRKKICKEIGEELWQAHSQLATSLSPVYVPDLENVRPYDPAKAKQLLAEAGHPNGFKTKIISTPARNRDMVLAIQAYLKAVGIDAEVETVDSGKFYQYSYDGWNNGLLVSPTNPSRHPMAGTNVALSSRARFAKSMARSPEWQALLDQALAAPDYDSLVAIAKQVVRKTFDDVMLFPIYTQYRVAAFAKGVYGTNWDYLWGVPWTPQEAFLSK